MFAASFSPKIRSKLKPAERAGISTSLLWNEGDRVEIVGVDLRICMVAVHPKAQICSTVGNQTSHVGKISFLKFGLVFGNCDLDLYPHGRTGAPDYC